LALTSDKHLMLQMNRNADDIEGDKRTAEALRESERLWREAFEHNPLMYFMVDRTGTVRSVNTFGASQLGYGVSELVGRSLLDLVFEDDRELARTNMTACLESPGRSLSWEARKIRKDGTVLWIRQNAKAMRWSGDELVVLIAGDDITERYAGELEAVRLAAIVSSSDDAIISKTLDGTISSWNAGATNIFGYEASEIIGQPIFHIIPPELHNEERQILARLQRGERIQHYETARTAKDGHRIEISLTVSPLFNKAGKVVGASKVARDITATKRVEAELMQARTELVRVARVTTLGELTAAIAHEVNQPLTGLVNSGNACLRWLAGEPPDLEAARKSVELMVSAGRRAGEVITRIRALIAKSPPQQEPLNINDAITEVVALIDREVQRNRVSLQVDLAGDVPPILGDRIQLQQVVLNLMLNAIEAMNKVGDRRRDLSVATAKDEGNGALVTVRDSGIGLDATSVDRLFEAFYTTKAHGMGIGLAVSRTIIEAHGGRLWATPGKSQGAVFQFSLPAGGEAAS
jgi:PAS domain S-box-containing protein